MTTILYTPSDPGLPAITSTPEVVFGEPCIAGTNITVNLLLGKLGAGWSDERLHDDYPRMPAGSIRVAREYAAEVEAGRLPAVWSPIIGSPTPWQHHVYAGLTDDEIDDLAEAIREARKPLPSPSRP